MKSWLIGLSVAMALVVAVFVIIVLRRRRCCRIATTMMSMDSQRIPLNFIQTSRTTRFSLAFQKQLLEHNQSMCPEFQFHFFDNADIDRIIRTHFSRRVYDAFLKINPQYGACISDFARYCLLYLMGGIYMDIKSEVIQPVDPLLRKACRTVSASSDVLIVAHWRDVVPAPHWEKFGPKGEIMNWIMIATARHPILRRVIDNMVLNIETARPGRGKLYVLELTGPILLTRTIRESSVQEQDTVVIMDEINDYFKYISTRCAPDCRTLYYRSVGETPYDRVFATVLR